MKCFEIRITGKVQGVGYRQGTRATAKLLHLKGWVKNLNDGSVQIKVWGRLDVILTLITWCQKGPYFAVVKDIRITENQFEDVDLKTFDIH